MSPHPPTFQLSPSLPRPPEDFQHWPLYRGLGSWRFFGYFAGLGVVLLAGSLLIPPYETGVLLLKLTGCLIFALLSRQLLKLAHKKVAWRQQILRTGKRLNGTVTHHQKAFNPFSSWKDWVIEVAFEDEGQPYRIQARLARRDDIRYAKKGEQLPLIWEPQLKRAFVPLEIGVSLSPDSSSEAA